MAGEPFIKLLQRALSRCYITSMAQRGTGPRVAAGNITGVLYGDTATGGPQSKGSFYSLSLGLGPFFKVDVDLGKGRHAG